MQTVDKASSKDSNQFSEQRNRTNNFHLRAPLSLTCTRKSSALISQNRLNESCNWKDAARVECIYKIRVPSDESQYSYSILKLFHYQRLGWRHAKWRFLIATGESIIFSAVAWHTSARFSPQGRGNTKKSIFNLERRHFQSDFSSAQIISAYKPWNETCVCLSSILRPGKERIHH